jgi:hypothetical protein
MCQTSANLLEHVLPAVPLRQWVLTLPPELRRRLAYDGKLFGEVSRLFSDSVLEWYRRRLTDGGRRAGRGGAVVVMQRSSSDLRVNPHLHGVFLDGLFVMGPDSAPVFRTLPRLSTTDTAEVLQIVRARVLRHLRRRGVLSDGSEATVEEDGALADDPVLVRLTTAAVSGQGPAGPVLRRGRVPVHLAGRWRALVIPPPRVEASAPTPVVPAADHSAERPRAAIRSKYWRWADLLRRAFGTDPLLCDRCGGPMEMIAQLTDPDEIRRYLTHVGEPSEPPALAPARGPPYYQSRVLRRRGPEQQVEMFDA